MGQHVGVSVGLQFIGGAEYAEGALQTYSSTSRLQRCNVWACCC